MDASSMREAAVSLSLQVYFGSVVNCFWVSSRFRVARVRTIEPCDLTAETAKQFALDGFCGLRAAVFCWKYMHIHEHTGTQTHRHKLLYSKIVAMMTMITTKSLASAADYERNRRWVSIYVVRKFGGSARASQSDFRCRRNLRRKTCRIFRLCDWNTICSNNMQSALRSVRRDGVA